MTRPTLDVYPDEVSVPCGAYVVLRIDGFRESVAEIAWSIGHIEHDYTEFIMESSAAPRLTERGLAVECTETKNLAPGIYLLQRLVFRDAAGKAVNKFSRADFGTVVFEAREATTPGRTVEALRAEIETIDVRRQADFLAGIGTGRSRYEAFVFFKGCLITRQIRLKRCLVIPLPGLSYLNELELVQSFASERMAQPPLEDTERLQEQARRGQPAAVLHFPHIRADSVEAARAVAERETDLLVALLSMERGAAGSRIGSIVHDGGSGDLFYALHIPSYGGNLLGGFVSGEAPRAIVHRMDALRNSPVLALYIRLFREAVREPHTPFQYFRFWSLLEMMARHKKYIGRPLRNWVGEVRHNAKSRAREIRDDAEELVFELLREHLSKSFGEDSFAADLKYGKLSEQLSIWYRRRNCVAHGGDCLCRDPSLPLVSQKYVICRDARTETAGRHDGYLSTIHFVTKAVLTAELGPSGSGSYEAAEHGRAE